MALNFKSILSSNSIGALALSILSQTSLTARAQEMTAEDVNDMALIWIGGHARSEWDKEMFTPYVVHKFQDNHQSWFFDGFLMIEGQLQELDENGNFVQQFSLGESTDQAAKREHWEYILDKQLGIIDGTGCKALDETIGDFIPTLGHPATKHKVIMMQCIPRDYAANWGYIGDKRIDFGNVKDKIEAMKWYTDRVIEKFDSCGFKNIVLDGMYWLREDITQPEEVLVKAMTAYYREKGLKSYWIPWLHANNYNNWKEMGFDMIYEQPGYFFSIDRPIERLEQACEDAWEYDFGIELEFEGNWVTGFDDKRQTLPQGNSALYDNSPVFHQRFIDYIDYLEEYAIFDFMQMSYYSGYQAVYDFAQSQNQKDKETMDCLASIVEKRHIASKWYIPQNAGIIDLDYGEKVTLTVNNGAIEINASQPVDVNIFTIDGKNIYRNNRSEATTYYKVDCNSGIYIVKASDKASKVIVK